MQPVHKFALGAAAAFGLGAAAVTTAIALGRDQDTTPDEVGEAAGTLAVARDHAAAAYAVLPYETSVSTADIRAAVEHLGQARDEMGTLQLSAEDVRYEEWGAVGGYEPQQLIDESLEASITELQQLLDGPTTRDGKVTNRELHRHAPHALDDLRFAGQEINALAEYAAAKRDGVAHFPNGHPGVFGFLEHVEHDG